MAIDYYYIVKVKVRSGRSICKVWSGKVEYSLVGSSMY